MQLQAHVSARATAPFLSGMHSVCIAPTTGGSSSSSRWCGLGRALSSVHRLVCVPRVYTAVTMTTGAFAVHAAVAVHTRALAVPQTM
eukprot:scaffold283324_cov18-Tisochrysis_lutea.AAC.2